MLESNSIQKISLLDKINKNKYKSDFHSMHHCCCDLKKKLQIPLLPSTWVTLVHFWYQEGSAELFRKYKEGRKQDGNSNENNLLHCVALCTAEEQFSFLLLLLRKLVPCVCTISGKHVT